MNAPAAKVPTLRIAAISQGMRVITPLKRIGRVEGIALNTSEEELHSRVIVRYLDAPEQTVQLQPKLLRAFEGLVMFPDEIESIRMRHGDRPLAPPPLPKVKGSNE